METDHSYSYPPDARKEANEAMQNLTALRLVLECYCDAIRLVKSQAPHSLWRAYELACDTKNRVHRILEALDAKEKTDTTEKEADDGKDL